MFIDGDYSWVILDDNTVIMYYLGEEIWTSRAFRLRVQAEDQAKEYVKKSRNDIPEDGITLDVQKVSVDPDSLFSRRKING